MSATENRVAPVGTRAERWQWIGTWYAFAGSLIASALGTGLMATVATVWAPLDATWQGPRELAFTKAVIAQAPVHPWLIGGAAVAMILAVAGIARSRWAPATKRWAILMASMLLTWIALVTPAGFFVGYFVLPKAANDAPSVEASR